ncbi:winged helix-turn-helix domain-containing protein [Streptomyces sp. NBC_01176]|uniref:winged helix-turn-helix domain-containing protein n=1 Tax=Streptomyces sp. NBC_01176 TaxID=2903760 RepID=UPI00386A36BF|nr:winged helix-turn-helix domain-containing protein [Streptomyces sp. NBC_01176]
MLDAGQFAEIVRRRLGAEYTLTGLGRAGPTAAPHGWSVQVPSRKAAERNEAKIAVWKDEQWPS